MSDATTDGTRGDEGTVTDWTRDDVLTRLCAEVMAGRPIVGSGAGSGCRRSSPKRAAPT